MNKNKPNFYTQTKRLICDWSDKKNHLIHHRMLKFYARHGMLVENVHEKISSRQSKWLEKNINFNTQKGNKAKNDFKKDFYKLLNNSFYGKTMENVRKSKYRFQKKPLKKLYNNNQSYSLREFINLMKIVIDIKINKMKLRWFICIYLLR